MRSLLRRRMRGSRGATEVGFALVVAALIAGAVLGKGLAATNVFTTDGLTWLGDDDRGTAVQINPETGQPQTELKVAAPGNELEIAQRDGVLVVNDTTTGQVTLIDVATLVASGRRSTTGAGATKILLDANQLYLVDRPRGTVHRLDPGTAADIGSVWSAGTPLADAALDGAGVVWALGIDGQLHTLAWSPGDKRLTDSGQVRRVDGSGARSVLVPHDTGVTVFAPDSGTVVQIGTGREQTLPVPQLGSPPVRGAPQAPADLVPASVSGTATVVIVHNGAVRTVAVGGFGCPRPGDPIVHRGRIYVPCLGSSKVLVLDADGARQSDIPTPGGDPKLVFDDGRLVIYVPGTNTGLVVNPDGTTRPIRTHDTNVPVQDPADPPTPTPPAIIPRRPDPPTEPPAGGPSPGGTSPGSSPSGRSTSAGPTSAGPTSPRTTTTTPVPPTSPPRVPPTTTPPAPPPTDAPSNVVAQARPDGTVLVSWAATGSPDGFTVRRTDNGTAVATVPGGARSAVVTMIAPGEVVSLIVEASFGAVTRPSAASAAVQAFTTPGPPGGVSVTMVAESTSVITVNVQWGASADNGRPVSYTVNVRNDRGFQQNVPTGGLSTGPVAVPCAGACSGMNIVATVQPSNEAGAGPGSIGSLAYTAPPVPVITLASCEYTGNSSMFCEVEAGPGSVRWTYNGNPLPSYDDRRFVRIGCSGSATIRVTVTVSNVSGSDTATTGVSRCTGPPN